MKPERSLLFLIGELPEDRNNFREVEKKTLREGSIHA
jgi:hypothetical protein